MATITNNQIQAGGAELNFYFKSPYQIFNALNRFAATDDIAQLNAEAAADGQKERLTNAAFRAVANAVQEYHGGGRPFVANMLERSGNGHFIQHRRRDVSKLGYFARANEGNFGFFGGAHSYSDDLFELLGVADLEHVTGSTDAADARYTVRINDTPRSYYNEFAGIVHYSHRRRQCKHTKMKQLKTLVIGVLVFAPFAVALSCDNIWFQILCVLYGAMLYATRRHFAKFWREFGSVVDTMLTNVEKQYNN